MANFSIRTYNVRREGGKEYKVHIRATDKELWDIFDRLCEKLETSGVDQEYYGPFVLTARRSR